MFGLGFFPMGIGWLTAPIISILHGGCKVDNCNLYSSWVISLDRSPIEPLVGKYCETLGDCSTLMVNSLFGDEAY